MQANEQPDRSDRTTSICFHAGEIGGRIRISGFPLLGDPRGLLKTQANVSNGRTRIIQEWLRDLYHVKMTLKQTNQTKPNKTNIDSLLPNNKPSPLIQKISEGF